MAGNYIELVVSATRDFAALPRKQAIEQALSELAEFFPQAEEAKLEKAALVKEMRATFGVPPGIDAARPRRRFAVAELLSCRRLDATGWPSTMESAARSAATWRPKLSAAAMGDPRTYSEAGFEAAGADAVDRVSLAARKPCSSMDGKAEGWH